MKHWVTSPRLFKVKGRAGGKGQRTEKRETARVSAADKTKTRGVEW